jgi:hypothetical protein
MSSGKRHPITGLKPLHRTPMFVFPQKENDSTRTPRVPAVKIRAQQQVCPSSESIRTDFGDKSRNSPELSVEVG